VLGPVGMFLSVPLTMAVKIALANHEGTRWVSVFLSSGQEVAAVSTQTDSGANEIES